MFARTLALWLLAGAALIACSTQVDAGKRKKKQTTAEPADTVVPRVEVKKTTPPEIEVSFRHIEIQDVLYADLVDHPSFPRMTCRSRHTTLDSAQVKAWLASLGEEDSAEFVVHDVGHGPSTSGSFATFLECVGVPVVTHVESEWHGNELRFIPREENLSKGNFNVTHSSSASNDGNRATIDLKYAYEHLAGKPKEASIFIPAGQRPHERNDDGKFVTIARPQYEKLKLEQKFEVPLGKTLVVYAGTTKKEVRRNCASACIPFSALTNPCVALLQGTCSYLSGSSTGVVTVAEVHHYVVVEARQVLPTAIRQAEEKSSTSRPAIAIANPEGLASPTAVHAKMLLDEVIRDANAVRNGATWTPWPPLPPQPTHLTPVRVHGGVGP